MSGVAAAAPAARVDRPPPDHESAAMDCAELLTVDAFIRHWAADRPGRPRDGGRAAHRLRRAGSQHRAAWRRRCRPPGCSKGDRIAWLGKNAVLYFTLLFGAARIGVVMVPVGWRLAAPERHYIVDDTEARLLFAGEGFADDARALAPQPAAGAARAVGRRGLGLDRRSAARSIHAQRPRRRHPAALHLGHHRPSQGRGAEQPQPVRPAPRGPGGQAALGLLGRRRGGDGGHALRAHRRHRPGLHGAGRRRVRLRDGRVHARRRVRRHRAGGRDALLRRARGAADAGQPPALRAAPISAG